MKPYRNTLVASAIAALLLTGIHSGIAQTNSGLYPARFTAISLTANGTNGLAHSFFGNTNLIENCAAEQGLTNLTGLRLVYNPSNTSLEVVNGTNLTAICTPIAFSGGISLTNTNDTHVELEAFAFVEGSTVANGLLSASERLTWGSSNQLTSFSLIGRLDYTAPAVGTNTATIYRGILRVGDAIRSEHRDNDDDNGSQGDDDHHGGDNGGNQHGGR